MTLSALIRILGSWPTILHKALTCSAFPHLRHGFRFDSNGESQISILNIDFEDVGQVVLPALRHRLLLNFEAQGENITTEAVVQEILASKEIER